MESGTMIIPLLVIPMSKFYVLFPVRST